MKNWFSKDKASSGSESGAPSSHPDEATLIDQPSSLKARKEMSEGERLAADIQSQAMQSAATSRQVPGARPGAPVREEAAALYAAGRAQDAAKVLTRFMQDSRGQVDRRLWYMLFDLYQATDQHLAFERLALLFAKAFNASPPAWEQWGDGQESMLGRNVLVVDGSPLAMNADRVSEFVAAARQASGARLDLSRTILDDGSDAADSMDRLRSLMARLRRHRVRTILMGETRLGEELRQWIGQDLPQSKSAWLLLFEILQWRAEEHQFDTLALQFAARFEQSPPGYEPDGAVAVEPQEEHALSPEASSSSLLIAPSRLDEVLVEGFLTQVDERLRLFGACRIDFSRTRQLSFAAATGMASFFSALGIQPGRIVAVKPTELVLAILEMSGGMSYLGLEPRKR